MPWEGGAPQRWSQAKDRRIDRAGRWTIECGGTVECSEDGVERSAEDGQERRSAGVIAVPVFGYTNHLCLDRHPGFIRRFTVTDAVRHDGHEPAAVFDRGNTASAVCADAACRRAENLARLERYGCTAPSQRRGPRGRARPRHRARGNGAEVSLRRRIEHVRAVAKCPTGPIVRCVGPIRATARLIPTNAAHTTKRLVPIEG